MASLDEERADPLLEKHQRRRLPLFCGTGRPWKEQGEQG
jgi:hypothetical protein